jgi:hypothetical protein
MGGKIVEVLGGEGTVSVQWITFDVGIVRYHAAGGFGSPAAFAVTMRMDGDIAEFFAGMGRGYTRQTHRAMRNAMRCIGISRVRYERRGATIRPKELTQ